ncbi:acyl-CoA dehydrogenase N-terminal domain-containing protein [Acidisoma sp. L85]|uniref:acyl-CoA dehydrogenase N-terminal domain-containing protein n=1 Tax=Acidisoma sp. L85 TaxID=1641850 RepID=UPI00352B2596
MPAYSAPVTDMLYVLGELLSVESVLSELPGHADASLPLMGEVLREAARFCSEIVFPLNRLGDQEGCTLDNGVVRTPKGFPEAYAAFVASGWAGLSHDANHGGQGLPRALQVLFDEMLSSANFSFGLVTSLTCAAVKAISAHAGRSTGRLSASYGQR